MTRAKGIDLSSPDNRGALDGLGAPLFCVADLRQQFDVNVFGAVATIKAVLPAMRLRRSGFIIVVSSLGGLISSPGLSFYNGSKFALEGILGALRKEVAPFGIVVTALEPGPFRTDWSGRSMVHAVRSIGDYDATYEPIRMAREAANGNQPGDPQRAARVVVDLIEAEAAPGQLLLGRAALAAVSAPTSAVQSEEAQWEAVSLSTDFPVDGSDAQ